MTVQYHSIYPAQEKKEKKHLATLINKYLLLAVRQKGEPAGWWWKIRHHPGHDSYSHESLFFLRLYLAFQAALSIVDVLRTINPLIVPNWAVVAVNFLIKRWHNRNKSQEKIGEHIVSRPILQIWVMILNKAKQLSLAVLWDHTRRVLSEHKATAHIHTHTFTV